VQISLQPDGKSCEFGRYDVGAFPGCFSRFETNIHVVGRRALWQTENRPKSCKHRVRNVTGEDRDLQYSRW
jgi:hypothetical protein